MDVVLLSCVAGAIRSFLQKCRVQDPDDILVCIRTDVRPQHTRLNLDNKFSLAFIKLPVGTEGQFMYALNKVLYFQYCYFSLITPEVAVAKLRYKLC